MDIGGAQRLVADLLPVFKKSVDEVSLLVFHRVHNVFEKALEDAGIEILSLGTHNRYNPLILFKMKRVMENYDIVHVHLFPTLYWAAIANIGIHKSLIYTEHNTMNKRRNKVYLRPIEKWIYSRYDRIISISAETQRELTGWLQEKGERYVTIYNGVDVKRFASIKAEVDKNSLIMVARFAHAKDQETIIRALPHIKKGVSVSFVGDGDNIGHCKECANSIGVIDRVNFLGLRSDVAELIASSYIGIQSSKWEGFGLTAVEIMACSKPIIATEVDGLKQIVEGAGILFPVGDEISLAKVINKLLSDSDYYAEVAKKCRKRANNYDISIMADNYLAEYHAL